MTSYLPRIAMIVTGLFNFFPMFIGFGFFPEKMASNYGFGSPDLTTASGHIAISLGHGCSSFGMGVAALMFMAYRSKTAEVKKVALLSYGLAALVAFLNTVILPWPPGADISYKYVFVVQCGVLTALSLAGYATVVPEEGYTQIV